MLLLRERAGTIHNRKVCRTRALTLTTVHTIRVEETNAGVFELLQSSAAS